MIGCIDVIDGCVSALVDEHMPCILYDRSSHQL